MMFEFELEETEKVYGTLFGLEKKFEALAVIRPAIKSCNGTELEDVLWMFNDPVDALKAALKTKNVMARFN